MQYEKNRKCLSTVQRRRALGVTSSYRTVSESVVLVITGVIPVDLLAQWRNFVHQMEDTLVVAEAEKSPKNKRLAPGKDVVWRIRVEGGRQNLLASCPHGSAVDTVKLITTSSRCLQCRYCGAPKDDVLHSCFHCGR